MKDNLKINIFLDESDNIFAPYYSEEDFHLNSDIENFILSKLDSAKRRDVEIIFIGKNDCDDKSLKTAILNTYSDHLKDDKYKKSRNNKKAIISYLIGIIVGFLYVWYSKDYAYIAGILSIVCWVFVWTGTEVFFFDNSLIKTDIRKCENLLNARVHKDQVE